MSGGDPSKSGWSYAHAAHVEARSEVLQRTANAPPTRRYVIPLTGLLLVVGLYHRYCRRLPSVNQFIFGDLTDGYFSLWILEHTRLFFGNWNLSAYLNTRFFYPDNHLVLFWSDNLFVCSLMYSLIYALTHNMIASFNLSVYSMIVFGYAACCYFFKVIFESCRTSFQGNVADRYQLLIPALAYTAAFSDPRMLYTAHFQNHMANVVILGTAFCIKYIDSMKVRYLWGGLASWLILCYSAPYYAAIFSVLLALAVGLLLRSRGWEVGRQIARRHWCSVTVCLGLAAPILAGYFGVLHPYDSQLHFRAELWHLMSPLPETRLFGLLAKAGLPVRDHTHESLVYLGVFLGPVLIVSSGTVLVVQLRQLQQRRPLVLLCLSFLCYLLSDLWCAGEPWIPFLALIICLLAFFCALTALRKQGPMVQAFLLLAMLVTYGTAFGPSARYSLGQLNPTIWGLLAEIIPGFRSIRAVGRFGAIGMVWLLGIAFCLVLHLAAANRSGRQRGVFLTVLLLAMAANAVFDQTRLPYANRYDFARLVPDRTEEDFFGRQAANAIVLPVNNLSLIPEYMIFFERLPQINLVNGYSGQFSSTLWSLYEGYGDMLDARALEILKKINVDYVVWDKRFYSPAVLTANVKAVNGKLVFENERMAVCVIRE